jgi:hypothetical protein
MYMNPRLRTINVKTFAYTTRLLASQGVIARLPARIKASPWTRLSASSTHQNYPSKNAVHHPPPSPLIPPSPHLLPIRSHLPPFPSRSVPPLPHWGSTHWLRHNDLLPRRPLMLADDPPRMQNTGDPAENAEQDVDQEIAVAARLQKYRYRGKEEGQEVEKDVGC